MTTRISNKYLDGLLPEVRTPFGHVDEILRAMHCVLLINEQRIQILAALEQCSKLLPPQHRTVHDVVSLVGVVHRRLSHCLDTEELRVIGVGITVPRLVRLIFLDRGLVDAYLGDPIVVENVVFAPSRLGRLGRGATVIEVGARHQRAVVL